MGKISTYDSRDIKKRKRNRKRKRKEKEGKQNRKNNFKAFWLPGATENIKKKQPWEVTLTHTHTHTHTYIYIYIYIYMCVYLHMSIFVYMGISVQLTACKIDTYVYVYIYIYIVNHRQICFVLSELISVARHISFPLQGSKPGWLKQQSKLLTLQPRGDISCDVNFIRLWITITIVYIHPFNGYRDLNSYMKRLAINANSNTIISLRENSILRG